jgi:DNA-binding transcriptional regulator YdaS (Cro superfamily)
VTLAKYLDPMDHAGRVAFARSCGTTYNYLHQVAGGHRRASGKLARRIERRSGGAVTRASLRRDLFG